MRLVDMRVKAALLTTEQRLAMVAEQLNTLKLSRSVSSRHGSMPSSQPNSSTGTPAEHSHTGNSFATSETAAGTGATRGHASIPSSLPSPSTEPLTPAVAQHAATAPAGTSIAHSGAVSPDYATLSDNQVLQGHYYNGGIMPETLEWAAQHQIN